MATRSRTSYPYKSMMPKTDLIRQFETTMASRKKASRSRPARSSKTAGAAAHALKPRASRSTKRSRQLPVPDSDLASALLAVPEDLPLNGDVEQITLLEEPEELELPENGAEAAEVIPEAELVEVEADEDLIEEDVLEAHRPEVAAE